MANCADITKTDVPSIGLTISLLENNNTALFLANIANDVIGRPATLNQFLRLSAAR